MVSINDFGSTDEPMDPGPEGWTIIREPGPLNFQESLDEGDFEETRAFPGFYGEDFGEDVFPVSRALAVDLPGYVGRMVTDFGEEGGILGFSIGVETTVGGKPVELTMFLVPERLTTDHAAEGNAQAQAIRQALTAAYEAMCEAARVQGLAVPTRD